MNRHTFLTRLHEVLQPRTYLEVGVDAGLSMQLSRVPSIGIDPDFAVVTEVQSDLHLARIGSDEFFARRRPVAHLPLPVVDLAFIDGMHLAEYALRDIISVERFTRPTSVLVVDDVLPRNVEEANRKRTTWAWTGDVYKALQALRDLRPDLVILEVNTRPTGVVVVLCPDASRKGVLPGYDEWLETAISPDPQVVPVEVLTRARAHDPERLLSSSGWGALAGLRTSGTSTQVRAAFADVL